MGLIKNFSTKFNFKPNEPAISIPSESSSETTRKNKRQDCDDPDTPPSSPINLPYSNSIIAPNLLYDVFESAKLKCQSALVAPLSSYFAKKTAPTPPGTPTNCLELAEEAERASDESEPAQNFFDQIVNKLNVFSFKTVSQQRPPSTQTWVMKKIN